MLSKQSNLSFKIEQYFTNKNCSCDEEKLLNYSRFEDKVLFEGKTREDTKRFIVCNPKATEILDFNLQIIVYFLKKNQRRSMTVVVVVDVVVVVVVVFVIVVVVVMIFEELHSLIVL